MFPISQLPGSPCPPTFFAFLRVVSFDSSLFSYSFTVSQQNFGIHSPMKSKIALSYAPLKISYVICPPLTIIFLFKQLQFIFCLHYKHNIYVYFRVRFRFFSVIVHVVSNKVVSFFLIIYLSRVSCNTFF